MNITYRLMTIEDYSQAYDLWILCGNGLNDKDDSKEGIEKYLKRNPTTSFVAVDGENADITIINSCAVTGASEQKAKNSEPVKKEEPVQHRQEPVVEEVKPEEVKPEESNVDFNFDEPVE